MTNLRLYAVGLDEVRDIVGADDALTQELRAVADREFALAQPPAQPGLLGKLGPLFRRPPGTPVIPANHPTPADFDALVGGQWITPERLQPAWRLMETLVAYRSWGQLRVPWNQETLNRIDFDLSRSGSPSALSLAALLHSDAHLGLSPLPGLCVGYRNCDHAMATAEHFADAAPQVADSHIRDHVDQLVTWLNGFGHWRELAPELGRPAPDLWAFHSSTPPARG